MYCARIIENPGNKYVAIWQKIKFENGPYPRTSHTCVSYKNRYLVIVGGETETVNITSKKPNEGSGESEHSQEKQPEVAEPKSPTGKGKFDRRMSMNSSSEDTEKEPLSDVWIFDTFFKTWK